MSEIQRGTTPAPGEGESVWLLGDLFEVKLAGEDTGGAYSMVEETSPTGTKEGEADGGWACGRAGATRSRGVRGRVLRDARRLRSRRLGSCVVSGVPLATNMPP
jgi:hypothetical protein